MSYSNKQQFPPNLEDIRQENDGGSVAISGFDYQFHFAARKCIEMLAEPGKYEFVSCEAHEDVVVRLTDGSYEFYQVKLKADEQWNLSDLKSRGVWANFIKLRDKFGSGNSFWFVSDQTAKHSTKKGRGNRVPDLGRMRVLTQQGKNICYQNERDKNSVARLLERLDKDWSFNDMAETETFFWSIRILTDHEHERGLESCNVRDLQKLLESRGILADSLNLSRIYNSIVLLLREAVKRPDTATDKEAIEMREIRSSDLENLITGPFTELQMGQFTLDGTHDESQQRDLRQKTKEFDPKSAAYFIDSRNYFAVLYWQQVSYAKSYIDHLRHRVWGVCHRYKIEAADGQNAMQTYRTILKGLNELANHEKNLDPPIEVTPDYLHGMMCQLTAECYHDWYTLEE